ncbi:MAG: LptE family protein [Cyclonatronaceae bacterium]
MHSKRVSIGKGLLLLAVILAGTAGCFRYSFTGVAIPADVRTIHIPFFQDQSGSGLGNLSDQLNDAMINRFINQSRLQLTGSPEDADVLIEGRITSYSNQPFSVAGDQQASLNRVQISVRATYHFTDKEQPEWQKNFSGSFEYDPGEDPVDGETNAALEALNRIADNMFSEAMGSW